MRRITAHAARRCCCFAVVPLISTGRFMSSPPAASTSVHHGSEGITAVVENGSPHTEGPADHHLSTRFRDTDDAGDDDAFDEDFDELEAASQEVHDLCYAMMEHLRRADPDPMSCLFERRTKRRFREPIPEQKRRLLHGHENRGNLRGNSYASRNDLDEGQQLFIQMGEKLLVLLTKPVFDRMIESAGKSCRDTRFDGVHRFKNVIERASWKAFPHRWFKHAPFEVQQLRADIPESAVKNTRSYRDHSTLRYLFTLMEVPHVYRAALENRMFEITSHYDPHATKQSTPKPSIA